MAHHVEALETRRRVLGDAHPDTLKSISEMGGLHARMHEDRPGQGHDAKAAEYMALHQKLSGVLAGRNRRLRARVPGVIARRRA